MSLGDTYSCQDIIKGINSLDLKVFEYLDAVYFQKVTNYVCNNSGTLEEGQDHFQNVLIEIYLKTKKNKLKWEGNFESYFWMITKRRWIDVLRKKKSSINLSVLEDQLYSIEDSPSELEPDQDDSQLLLLALNKSIALLSEDDRKYIESFYFAKESMKSIADSFGTSYSYARLKLHRIRQKLKKTIKADVDYNLMISQDKSV